ncbi:unnamed protein product [Rotaria sp. Silwood2]|nr:unnamed protein product [Rotaria sp. Silwood2]CAF4689248.1 unnamed protein product [Rotaria sp. Silwood2]
MTTFRLPQGLFDRIELQWSSNESIPGIQSFCKWRQEVISDPKATVSLKKQLKAPRNIYIGAGRKKYFGWESFEYKDLDITKPQDFSRWFCPESIAAFLTEHTVEHISYEDMIRSLKLMHQYLMHGGYIRIALPVYRLGRKKHIFGSLEKAYGHINAPTVDELIEALNVAGFFDIRKLEYGDAKGFIHTSDWDRCKGMIDRSVKYDYRNQLWRRSNRYNGLNLSKSDEIAQNIIKTAGVTASTIVDAYKQ